MAVEPVPAINTLDDASRVLEQYHPRRVKRADSYSTAYIERFMDYIGNPQERLRVVHVAGTSGKTSTCYYIAALLHAAGKKVGHTTSPHLYALNERVQIGVRPVQEQLFCQSLRDFLPLVAASGTPLTYFEIMTAFSYWLFERQGVTYAVMETGLGGLLDATNIVRRPDKVAVITDIGLDHQDRLGDTLASIAGHKAGIIQYHNSVFAYHQSPDVMAAITRRATQKHADVHTYQKPLIAPAMQQLPPYQQRNLFLACQVAGHLAKRDGFLLTDAHMERAVQISIPGRMQYVTHNGRTVILDAAHNPQKLLALSGSLDVLYPKQPVAAVVAFMKHDERRITAAAEVLARSAEHIIVVAPNTGSDIIFEDAELVKAYCKVAGQWSIETQADLASALTLLTSRPEPVLVVTGSLRLLHAVRRHITP